MKTQGCHSLIVVQICITFALVVSVNSIPNWPTQEFFERHYRNIAPPPSDLTSKLGSNSNIRKVNPESTVSSTAAALKPTKQGGTKGLKPRWSTRRRLSAREAVAVMEEELQRREAKKTNNTPIKDDIKDDIQPAASNTDSVVAAADRRSGHHMGVTGPVHTFIKTDKHGHYKWGVRHHAGHGFS